MGLMLVLWGWDCDEIRYGKLKYWRREGEAGG